MSKLLLLLKKVNSILENLMLTVLLIVTHTVRDKTIDALSYLEEFTTIYLSI